MPKGKELTEAEKAERAKANRAKFAELANKRLPKAIASLDAIAKLGSYKPSDAQKEFVLKQLAEAAQRVNAAFQGAKPTASGIEVPTE